MSDFRLPESEMKLHPAVRNFGPDVPVDYDQEPWLRIMAENLAERESMSIDAAREAIRSNGGLSEYTKPRDEVIPLSRTVSEDGE